MPTGIVRELEALMLVVEQWPQRRDTCLAQATAAIGGAAAAPQPVAMPLAGSTASRRASATAAPANSVTSFHAASGMDASHAAATLAWLADHNNMEARVVEQLVSLRPRVAASTGGGILSGQWAGQEGAAVGVEPLRAHCADSTVWLHQQSRRP